MKKLFFGLVAALGLALSAPAATISTNVTAGGTHLLLTSAATISQITVTAGTTDPVLVKFYDNNAADITYSNAAYTTFTNYVTNLVTTHVTSTGVTNNMTNSVRYSAQVTIAAATNDRPVSATLNPAASGAATVSGNYFHVKGIVFTTDTNATVTVTYSPAF